MNKILHVVPALAAGGIENLLLNYSIEGPIYENFQIDFVTHAKTGLIYETLLEKGFSVFYVTPKKESIVKNFKETAKVIKNGKYDIVHVHQTYSSFFTLIIAKIYKVPVRIVHSHTNIKKRNSFLGNMIRIIMRWLCCHFATDLWSCGLAAGKYLYGNKKEFYIMPNAISSNKIISNTELSRKKILEKINIDENKTIISQIGRFTYEKNHEFTIDLIRKIAEIDSNFVFVFAGDGPLKDSIIEKITNLGLLSKCRFLGNIDYIHELLSVSSVTLLPSLFEGFPVTVIEALFNGVPIICSDNISKEVELSCLCTRLPYKSELWVEKIQLYTKIGKKEKENCKKAMLESVYEILNARKIIFDKYISLLNERIGKKC